MGNNTKGGSPCRGNRPLPCVGALLRWCVTALVRHSVECYGDAWAQKPMPPISSPPGPIGAAFSGLSAMTTSALQNAASIAALFLTTEVVIADKPEKAAPMGPGGDEMGGMGFCCLLYTSDAADE